MEFFTRVEAQRLPSLYYADRLVCMGSCFADRMGQLFRDARFRVVVNPHGVLFNPQSIALTIERALSAGGTIPELQFQEERWVSLDYHSQLSATTKEEALDKIQNANELLNNALGTAQWLVLTMGTAWVYRLRATGQVVANCHHFPASHFTRELLSVQEIVATWHRVLELLRERNPTLRVLLTVSPVRHLRDGMMDNSVSKATLLLAVHQLAESEREVYYFPSYEIMMDELRDYRFYEADMTQPSVVAREYIGSRLMEVWFAPETRALFARIEQLHRMEEHIPRNTESDSYRAFVRKREALREEIESAL